MPGVFIFMVLKSVKKKRAIVFVDGNNWYHNLKATIGKPRIIELKKLSQMIGEHFDLDIVGIKYYNSVPDIGLGDIVYYKHMVFLDRLKKQGIKVQTRKLKKIKENDKIIRIEKGVDVMIAVDMVSSALVEDKCDSCILISGDADFVPVMQLIKKAGKEVISVSVMKGYAREMLQGDFRFWMLKKLDLEKCMIGSSYGKKN
jgi:uncharacterized LabA/DUF88 family protein|tara:strand:- start:167 stop:769 length:603 start_codon:yes stop_codon:yes gene_type:complete